MSLRWGVIGPGNIADSEMAPAINRDPRSELVAVVSRDQERAEQFAKRHGANWAGTEYGAMLALSTVDAVLITTPNALHARQIVEAARAGKHVLCDKPMSTTLAGAELALDACREAGVRLGINFQTRYFACFQEARRVIDSGEIGDVIEVQIDASPGLRPPGSWRADPQLAGLGSVNNIAVHLYDLIRFLLGKEVVEVSAMFNNDRATGGIETLPLVLMRFDGGALAYANGNQATPFPLNDFTVYGSKGRINGRGITRPLQQGSMKIVTSEGERTSNWSTSDCYSQLMAAFSNAVLAGDAPSPSGVDGLRSVQLTDAIARSAAEGRVVEVLYE